jgi:hypothetical protein
VRAVVLLAALALAVAPAGASGGAPAFRASVSAVRLVELRHSYRPACPVGPAELRTVRVSHWGFDGRVREGALVVHRRVAADVVAVFRDLFAARVPVRRMRPVSVYRGSDAASMAADNTSAFNCRRTVGGSGGWSRHAYGLAVDVNPVENPYVLGGRVLPPAGRAYVDRRHVRPGMAVPGGPLVRAFERRGWRWGGRWRDPDYQHFSAAGG